MSQISLVREPVFMLRQILTMENYRIFAPGEIGSSDSLPVKEMFKSWVNNLKNISHRWRVE
jgi:hypothetical protein